MGEGYGKTSWNVRAIWENYAGWFHHRSTTELYGVAPAAIAPDLVAAAGADALAAAARARLDAGEPVAALHLTDIVLAADPGTTTGPGDVAAAATRSPARRQSTTSGSGPGSTGRSSGWRIDEQHLSFDFTGAAVAGHRRHQRHRPRHWPPLRRPPGPR